MRVADALVGRAGELATLTEAMSAASRGQGRLVLVRGEAGIGKTRLIDELAQRAAPSHVVLTGRAVPGGGAYRPVAEALVGLLRSGTAVPPEALGPYRAPLARVLPDWIEPGDQPQEPDADPALVLGEAVARFLAEVGRERPCLLVLEDLQWADADTHAVVLHLATAVRGLPVLVVVSARDDEPGTDPTAGLELTPGVVTLAVGRLPDDAAAELATLVHGQLDEATLRQLTGRAEGLPLLVEELLAADGCGTGASDVRRTGRVPARSAVRAASAGGVGRGGAGRLAGLVAAGSGDRQCRGRRPRRAPCRRRGAPSRDPGRHVAMEARPHPGGGAGDRVASGARGPRPAGSRGAAGPRPAGRRRHGGDRPRRRGRRARGGRAPAGRRPPGPGPRRPPHRRRPARPGRGGRGGAGRGRRRAGAAPVGHRPRGRGARRRGSRAGPRHR